MSFTLKVISRALDDTGHPRIQAWWPGVKRIVRNDERPLHEVLADCWSAYGQIEADYAPRSAEMTEFDPNVTLLWVTFDDGSSQYMIVENAYLLGPTGGTVDRIHGSSY